MKKNKISGYYVDNILDKKGKKHPKRLFINNTNRWNLDQANKFIDMLKYINENNVNIDFVHVDEMDVNDVDKSFYEKYYLPKYFNLFKKKGEIDGFCINGYPDDKYKDGKFKKVFTLKNRTMDETYEEGIEYLNNLKLGIKM